MPQIDSNRQPIMYRVATDLNGSPLLDSDGSLLELVVEAKQPEKLSKGKKICLWVPRAVGWRQRRGSCEARRELV